MNASSNSTQNLFEIFVYKSKRLLDLKSVFKLEGGIRN